MSLPKDRTLLPKEKFSRRTKTMLFDRWFAVVKAGNDFRRARYKRVLSYFVNQIGRPTYYKFGSDLVRRQRLCWRHFISSDFFHENLGSLSAHLYPLSLRLRSPGAQNLKSIVRSAPKIWSRMHLVTSVYFPNQYRFSNKIEYENVHFNTKSTNWIKI